MANYNYIELTGVIVPDTADTLAAVQGEYRSVFGQDLVVTADTPQGVLIAAETQARSDVASNNAALANQFNPNTAAGSFLDAICALTGIQRIPATRSVVVATVTGIAGTEIPAGSQARTSDGDLFEAVTAITIGSGGSATGDFRSVEYGPIPAGAGELTTIVSGVLGWETVTNVSAAVLGSAEQSDLSLRAYRRNTLAFQGVALSEAITSALYATEGVKSLSFRENTAATTQTIDGVSMVAHSVYACVDGGTDNDVAVALLNNKSSGAAWNGGESVTVTDSFTDQEYVVKFDRPDEISILIKVTVKSGVESDIRSAILAYAAGEIEGESGFVVGADVSPFEIAGAINRIYPSVWVQKVECSILSPISYSTDEIPIAIFEKAVTSNSLISVVYA